MFCFLDIKKTPFWNLGKKVLGVGEKYLKKGNQFLGIAFVWNWHQLIKDYSPSRMGERNNHESGLLTTGDLPKVH